MYILENLWDLVTLKTAKDLLATLPSWGVVIALVGYLLLCLYIGYVLAYSFRIGILFSVLGLVLPTIQGILPPWVLVVDILLFTVLIVPPIIDLTEKPRTYKDIVKDKSKVLTLSDAKILIRRSRDLELKSRILEAKEQSREEDRQVRNE
jgi:hypothetical protein